MSEASEFSLASSVADDRTMYFVAPPGLLESIAESHEDSDEDGEILSKSESSARGFPESIAESHGEDGEDDDNPSLKSESPFATPIKVVTLPLTTQEWEIKLNTDEGLVLCTVGQKLILQAVETLVRGIQPKDGSGQVLAQLLKSSLFRIVHSDGAPCQREFVKDLWYITCDERNYVHHNKRGLVVHYLPQFKVRMFRALRELCPNWRLVHYNAGEQRARTQLNLNEEIKLRVSHINNLNESIQQRDSHIDDLHDYIRQCEATIQEKDAKLEVKDATIAEKTKTIGKLKDSLRYKRSADDSMYSSSSKRPRFHDDEGEAQK